MQRSTRKPSRSTLTRVKSLLFSVYQKRDVFTTSELYIGKETKAQKTRCKLWILYSYYKSCDSKISRCFIIKASRECNHKLLKSLTKSVLPYIHTTLLCSWNGNYRAKRVPVWKGKYKKIKYPTTDLLHTFTSGESTKVRVRIYVV